MTLDSKDLQAIEQIVEKVVERVVDQKLKPIQNDLAQIKMDVGMLAKLNHLDGVKKDERLFRVYGPDDDLKEG